MAHDERIMRSLLDATSNGRIDEGEDIMDAKESCILTAVFASAKDFSVTIGTEADGAEELAKENKRLAEQKREYEERKTAQNRG